MKRVTTEHRDRNWMLFLLGCCLSLASSSSDAAMIKALSKGVIGGVPPKSAPGDPISFDYRSICSGLPLELVSLRITYSDGISFSSVNLQFSSGELLSVPMLAGGTSIFEWYNPNYVDPALLTQIPHAPLTQGLWNELSPDGVLDAHVWIDGASATGSFYQFAATLEAWDRPNPEPSAAMLIAAAALLARRVRRNAMSGESIRDLDRTDR
jgi:hypothetical protein